MVSLNPGAAGPHSAGLLAVAKKETAVALRRPGLDVPGDESEVPSGLSTGDGRALWAPATAPGSAAEAWVGPRPGNDRNSLQPPLNPSLGTGAGIRSMSGDRDADCSNTGSQGRAGGYTRRTIVATSGASPMPSATPRVVRCLAALLAALVLAAAAAPLTVPSAASTLTRQSATPVVAASALDPDLLADVLPDQRPAIALVAETLSRYRIEAGVDEAAGTVVGTAVVTWRNPADVPLAEVWFRLFPNAGYYGEGGLIVGDVLVDGAAATTALALEETALRVDLPAPVAPGDEATLTLPFVGTVPADSRGSYGIFQRDLDRGTWVLSGWHPTLAVYDPGPGGGWNLPAPTPAGDPTYAASSLFEVSLSAPTGWRVVASGVSLGEEGAGAGASGGEGAAGSTGDEGAAGSTGDEAGNNGVVSNGVVSNGVASNGVAGSGAAGDRMLHRLVAGPAREFTLVLDADFALAEATAEAPAGPAGSDAPAETVVARPAAGSATPAGGEGTVVRAWGEPGTDPAALARSAETAAAALTAFGERFGAYPFMELDLVETDLDGAFAVSWAGLIFLDADALLGREAANDPVGFDTVVAHEVAHLWWGAMVGSDSNTHPWINEGLATVSSLGYWFWRGDAAALDASLNRWVLGPARSLLGAGDAVVDLPIAAGGDPAQRGWATYGKATLGFLAIRAEIGDAAFWDALAAVDEAWRFGIARPEDFLLAFEAESGQDLDALWNEWFGDADMTADEVEAVADSLVDG
jgi:hypothetical protein